MNRTAPGVGVALSRAVKASEKTGARSIRFIASDETVDRYGDIIRASGWKLDNFKKNPVLLFGHDSRSLPVGKVLDVRVEGTQLLADTEFMPEGMSGFADEVWRAVDGGFLNASSVGFMPTESPNALYASDDPGPDDWPTGFEFVAQELLELSVVPVPANPEALAIARSLDISERTQRLIFDGDPRVTARAMAEHRSRSIHIARQRAGFFFGGIP